MKKKQNYKIEDIVNNIFIFCEACFNLIPQPIKPEFKNVPIDEWTVDMFGDEEKVYISKDFKDAYYKKYNWYSYIKKTKYSESNKNEVGHLSWQQVKVLNKVQKKIDSGEKVQLELLVLSGTGIGKTMIISIISNFLYIRNSYTGGMITSPTAGTSEDGMWKEVGIWLDRVPEAVKRVATGDSIRIITGFIKRDGEQNKHSISRRNIEKGRTGAIAGFHAPFVFKIVDEASDVDNPIITEMQMGLTDDEYVFILISNPRLSTGRTFVRNLYKSIKEGIETDWEFLQFSGEESPNTSEAHAKKALTQNLREGGRESYVYKVAVRGEYSEDNMDADGWVPLISDSMLTSALSEGERNHYYIYMGVDPSDGGGDETSIVVRSDKYARIAFSSVIRGDNVEVKVSKHINDTKKKYTTRRIIIDSFGVGAKTLEHYLKNYRANTNDSEYYESVRGINVGDSKLNFNKRKFFNKRAELCWKLREWILGGGKLVGNYTMWQELLNIYYKRGTGDKIEIMTKRQMKKSGMKSPNRFDALMLSFSVREPKEEEIINSSEKTIPDLYKDFFKDESSINSIV